MANTFITPDLVARVGLEILRREIVLPGTVKTDAREGLSTQKAGTTVDVRKPAELTARVYTQALRAAGAPIVIDDVTETTVPVTLDTYAYSAVAVTDEDLTLELEDFASQVLAPQIEAVARRMEDRLAAEINALASEESFANDLGNVHEKVLAARKRLNDDNVPMNGRTLAVSTEIETALLSDPENRLIRYDATGDSANSALREASIGRLYGFDVVVSNALGDGTAAAYHRDALAMVMVAPAVPEGAGAGAVTVERGLAMRWLRDYNSGLLQDQSILSSLVGAALLDGRRIVKLTTAP